ncbi:MAG: hypothetical protein JRN16_00420 [Nitrososphaerota archaeon]|nr:hypothetical protein [Nitrososphaerota archaeon]MDG7030314.1 hypothetical protein [Nitrososphaerota archaeon]
MPSGALVNFALNIPSAFVALLTSYYAYRANRVVRSSVLSAISVGFMLLGVGLALDAVTSLGTGQLLVDLPVDKFLAGLASFTYLTVQMVAYLVIAVGYGRAAYGRQAAAAASLLLVGRAAGLFGFSLLSYFVATLLLGFIVFQGFLLRSQGKGRFSAMILMAFGFILVAHAILLLSLLTVGAMLYLIGTGVQFLGFLSLLVFVIRSEVIGPG